jgi:hypothetical protein
VKAAMIHSFGPPDVVVVEDLPMPSPGPNEILVRVMAAGVAPWDAIIREGKSKVSPHLRLPSVRTSPVSSRRSAPALPASRRPTKFMASPILSSAGHKPSSPWPSPG